MKLLKKLLTGAAVAVAALSMMSCGGLSGLMQRTFGERDIFYYNDATYDSGAYGKWDVREEKNNSSEEWVRCVKMLFTKHTDLTGKIDLDVRTDEASGDGVLGVAFDVTKGKNSAGIETWNFGVVGVRYNKAKQTAEYYMSHFFNITDEDMAKENFNCSTYKAYDSSDIDTPYEFAVKTDDEKTWKILPTSVYTQKGDGTGVPKGTISVIVQIKEDPATGDYVAIFYGVDKYNRNANTDADAIKYCTILETSKVMEASKIGKNGKREAYVGVYGNIYGSQTLNGSMEIACLTNDAIVAY